MSGTNGTLANMITSNHLSSDKDQNDVGQFDLKRVQKKRMTRMMSCPKSVPVTAEAKINNRDFVMKYNYMKDELKRIKQ